MTPTMHMCTESDMVMKPTNAHKCIKVSYIVNIICLLVHTLPRLSGKFPTQPWQRPVTTWVYKPEAANTV